MIIQWVFVLCLLQVAELTPQSNFNGCPPPESILKCSCKAEATAGSQVTCSTLETHELIEATKALGPYPLQKLQISNFNANSFPTNLFKGVTSESLVLEKVEVEDASFRRGQKHFQGMEDSLKILEVSKSFQNGQRPLINLVLDHLYRLEVVILENNHIPEVGDDWFPSGPKSLHTLIFEQNGIETLGQKAFAALENLRLLAVAGNHMRSITRSMLPSTASKLKMLDLSNNKLSSIPEDLFSGMPNLNEIRLSGNLIRAIDADTWTDLWPQLNRLFLEENPLDCGEKMTWICEYRTDSIVGKCASPPHRRGSTLQKFCGM